MDIVQKAARGRSAVKNAAHSDYWSPPDQAHISKIQAIRGKTAQSSLSNYVGISLGDEKRIQQQKMENKYLNQIAQAKLSQKYANVPPPNNSRLDCGDQTALEQLREREEEHFN